MTCILALEGRGGGGIVVMILMCMHWQCCCNIVGVMTHCCRSASYKVMSPMLKPPKKDWQLLTGVDSCAVAASDGISSEVRIRPVHKH